MSCAKEMYDQVSKVKSFTFGNLQEKTTFIMSLKMFIKRVFIHDKSFFEIFHSVANLQVDYRKFIRSFGRFNTLRLFAMLFCVYCKRNKIQLYCKKFNRIIKTVSSLIMNDPFIDVFSDMEKRDKDHLIALVSLFAFRGDYECSFDDVVFVSTLF